jgi:hypothetical protein
LLELEGEVTAIISKQSVETQLRGVITVRDGTQESNVPLSAKSAPVLHFYEEDEENETTCSNFNKCVHDSLKELRHNV